MVSSYSMKYFIMIVFLLAIFGTLQISYAQTPQNSVGLSYVECQNKILDQINKTVSSIDKPKAISLALNSSEFQSKVNGYNYTYSSIFTNMTWNDSTCGDVKLKDVTVEFSVLNDTGGFEKFIQVDEDKGLTKVIDVRDVFVEICNENCPPPGPPPLDLLEKARQNIEPAKNVIKYYDPPLKQFKSGIKADDVICKQGLQLVIKKSNDKPACVKLDSVYPLVYRDWISQENLETSGLAFAAAQRFIETSPTFAFDGILGVMSMINLSGDSEFTEFPPTYTISAEFATRHQGYGNRSGQHLEENATWHKAILKVKGIEIISAVYDEVWDELNQKQIHDQKPAEAKESIKDWSLIKHDPKYGDCPVSFMTVGPNYTSHSEPPPMELLGKKVSSFEEAKKLTGMNELQLPKYVPECLSLKAVFANNQPDQLKQIVVLYLLKDTNISDITYVRDVQEKGLYVNYWEDKDAQSFNWADYVTALEAEAPHIRSSIKIGDSTILLLERNHIQLYPAQAQTIIGDKRIQLASKILETDEIEKIIRSMFE